MSKYILDKPLTNMFPKEWADIMDYSKTEIKQYANLTYFKYHIKSISEQKTKGYDKAVNNLIRGKSSIDKGEYEIIKNKVKENLLKRGLISENIYESYKYHTEGGTIDVSKLAAGDPNCCLIPNETYKNYFYELYISISYHSGITNEEVTENMAKILATVELLEQEHFFCKINLILPVKKGVEHTDTPNHLTVIPLFSHRDVKTLETMSSVLNEDLLRVIFFNLWEEQYGQKIAFGYGIPVEIPWAITPVGLNEVELASSIIDKIIQPGER